MAKRTISESNSIIKGQSEFDVQSHNLSRLPSIFLYKVKYNKLLKLFSLNLREKSHGYTNDEVSK